MWQAEVDSVSSMSALPNSVNPGQILLVYGIFLLSPELKLKALCNGFLSCVKSSLWSLVPLGSCERRKRYLVFE